MVSVSGAGDNLPLLPAEKEISSALMWETVLIEQRRKRN
jgi:hypothetical protein